MNSPTITMEKQAAIQKLEEYEQAARNNPRAYRDIDKGLVEGYRALAKGRRLVDVNEAIRVGGLNLAGQPRLAIARAHVASVLWWPARRINKNTWGGMKQSYETSSADKSSGVYCYGNREETWGTYRVGDDRAFWAVPVGTFDGTKVTQKDVRAFCPLIPLPLRPKFNLSNYFLLWEANWHPEPPRDPYLLKPLAGSLMEIIAEWDLTPLEIAAVRGASR